jgi:hypothetical protein
MIKRVIFIFLYILGFQLAYSQLIRDVHAEVKDTEGRIVEISYTLEDNIANVTAYYKVDLYLVYGENERQLLYNVNGAVGDSIRVGVHRILWKADDEFTRFKGNVRFEIRAVRNFMILKPDSEITLRRGKNYTFEWFGEGSTTDTLVMELYQFNTPVDTLDVIWGEYTYTWDIPKKLSPGEEYQLRIKGINDSNIDAFSETFRIKRQFPVFLQITTGVLAAGIGTVVYFILNQEEETDLPTPPPQAIE